MDRFRVLYAGALRAGRTTSLEWLSGAPPRVRGEYRPPPYRLEGKEVQLSSGETILLDAEVPYFGSAWVESYEAGTRDELEWIREVATRVLAFLPTIDGVVFVTIPWPHRHGWNAGTLRQLCGELSRAGLDLERLPFVFQHNQRDRMDATPLHRLMSAVSMPRCAHVESIAPLGYGVVTALETLVGMIRGGAPGGLSYAPPPEGREAPSSVVDRRMPESPECLFRGATVPITQNGEVTASLRARTLRWPLLAGDSALAFAFQTRLVKAPQLARGEYEIQVVFRVLEAREGERTRTLWAHPVAATMRLRGAAAVRYEPLSTGDEGHSPSLVLVGPPEALDACRWEVVPRPLVWEVEESGVGLVSRVGDRFELAERGDIAMFHVGSYNSIDMWTGRDGDGRVVELTFCGDTGAGMAMRLDT